MNSKKLPLIFLIVLLALGILYLIGFNNKESDEKYGRNSKISRHVRYVYFDLGANNGDSIDNFLGLSTEAKGGNIRSLFPDWFEGKKWIIHAFEANKLFNQKLVETKYNAEKLGHKVNLYLETAAWTYDGTISFYLDTINQENDYWSSSLSKTHPDVIKSNFTEIQVNCVDLARVINQYHLNDVIVVKMDIEGAEYQLVLDFVKKDVMKLIDYIAIEFHNHSSPYKRPEDVYLSLINLYQMKFLEWT